MKLIGWTFLSNDDTHKLENTKHFCAYPWIHTACNTYGDFRLCCMADFHIAKNNGDPYKFGKDSISEMWNSDYMRDIRNKMLNDEYIEACKECIIDEKIGKTSLRESMTKVWQDNSKFRDNLQYSVEHDGHVKYTPISYDIRLGNLCNLKCRMCGPHNSSQLAKEYEKINDNKSLSDYHDLFPMRKSYIIINQLA